MHAYWACTHRSRTAGSWGVCMFIMVEPAKQFSKAGCFSNDYLIKRWGLFNNLPIPISIQFFNL